MGDRLTMTPTEAAEARAQEEARAHRRPVRLTRAEVERVLAAIPPGSDVVLREMISVSKRVEVEPGADKYEVAISHLLRTLAEGMANA